MFGIIPNFYVSYESDPAPLTPGMKFKLALKVSTDPVTAAGALLVAAARQAGNSLNYGQGWGHMDSVLAQPPPMVFPTSSSAAPYCHRFCTRIPATSIKEQARPVPEFAMRCSVRLSPRGITESGSRTIRVWAEIWRHRLSRTFTIPSPIVVLGWSSAILRSARLSGLAQAWPRNFWSANSPEGVVT